MKLKLNFWQHAKVTEHIKIIAHRSAIMKTTTISKSIQSTVNLHSCHHPLLLEQLQLHQGILSLNAKKTETIKMTVMLLVLVKIPKMPRSINLHANWQKLRWKMSLNKNSLNFKRIRGQPSLMTKHWQKDPPIS